VKATTAKSKAVPDVNTEAAKPKLATKTMLMAQMRDEVSVPDVVTRLPAKDKDKLKDSVKTTTAKVSKPEVVAVKPKAARTVAPGTIAKAAMPTVKAAPAPEPAPVASPSTPARAGRPSSRLAQLTVPSMAQSVASTAAKASFMQTTESPLIVPPLASAVKKDPKLVNNWKLKPVDELTDADLIAMPDDEYMNDTQMAYFRLKLNKIKQDILSNAGETTEHLREDTVVVPDPADRATIEEEHALELRTRDRERKLLKKIEQSIQRIDAGDYGYCDETGESIGVGRLLARPTANLCLEAQQRRELKQKMFGD
jgi:DnaK suppressor protein